MKTKEEISFEDRFKDQAFTEEQFKSLVNNLFKLLEENIMKKYRYRDALLLIQSQARIPDGEDACLLILKTVREALGEK